MKRKIKLFVLIFFVVITTTGLAAEPFNVYFIGNSLTRQLTPTQLHYMFEERNVDLQFGSQVSGGKTMINHLNYRNLGKSVFNCWETNIITGKTYEPELKPNGDSTKFRFGRYETALANHSWDAVVFQLRYSILHDDFEAISTFIDICLKNNTTKNFYLFSPWPKRPKKDGDFVNIDIQKIWLNDYVAKVDDVSENAKENYDSRSYSYKLRDLLSEKYQGKISQIMIIPCGEVLFRLDKIIKDGSLKGLNELIDREPSLFRGLDDNTDISNGINILYNDAIHFRKSDINGYPTFGNYIQAITFYNALSGKSPVGLSAEGYGLNDKKDAALIKSIQKLVYEVIEYSNKLNTP